MLIAPSGLVAPKVSAVIAEDHIGSGAITHYHPS
jgi:hypothetical protein